MHRNRLTREPSAAQVWLLAIGIVITIGVMLDANGCGREPFLREHDRKADCLAYCAPGDRLAQYGSRGGYALCVCESAGGAR